MTVLVCYDHITSDITKYLDLGGTHGPRGEAYHDCVCVSREGSQPRDRGPPNGPNWHHTCGRRHDPSKASTDWHQTPEEEWCQYVVVLHEAVHLFPVSVPIFLLKGYCHKSPRCWRHAVSVSRVTCCHAAGNKIPHHSHNSSHVQTFQVDSLLSTLLGARYVL